MKAHPYIIVASALAEISRADLIHFVFPMGQAEEEWTVHFDLDFQAFGFGYFDDYGRFMDYDQVTFIAQFKKERRRFPKSPELEDIALIERAMSIGFASANHDYSCPGCESEFMKFGVQHKGETHA